MGASKSELRHWITIEEAGNDAVFDMGTLNSRHGCGGLAHCLALSLTATAVIFRAPDSELLYVHSTFWTPEGQIAANTEKLNFPYDLLVNKGYVRTYQGDSVDIGYIAQWFNEVERDFNITVPLVGCGEYEPVCGLDNLKTTEIVKRRDSTVLTAMRALKHRLKNKQVIYNNNPIMKWCLTNVLVKEDGDLWQLYSPSKTRPICGASALLYAYIMTELGFKSLV